MENDHLLKAFEKFGKVVRCVMKEPPKVDGKNFKPTKFGYIYFENKDDAKKASSEATKDEEVKALYENEDVYVNFLINKEAYGRYKLKNMRNKMDKGNMAPDM